GEGDVKQGAGEDAAGGEQAGTAAACRVAEHIEHVRARRDVEQQPGAQEQQKIMNAEHVASRWCDGSSWAGYCPPSVFNRYSASSAWRGVRSSQSISASASSTGVSGSSAGSAAAAVNRPICGPLSPLPRVSSAS